MDANHVKFRLRTKPRFFTERVDKHRNKLPKRLWSLHLWRCLKPNWTWSCTACASRPGLSREFGRGDLQRSLPTPAVLRFSVVSFDRWSVPNSTHRLMLRRQDLSFGSSTMGSLKVRNKGAREFRVSPGTFSCAALSSSVLCWMSSLDT